MAAQFKSILIGIGAVIVAVFAAFLKGRSDGVESEKSKARDLAFEENKRTTGIINDVQKEIASDSDSTIDDKLRSEWVRK